MNRFWLVLAMLHSTTSAAADLESFLRSATDAAHAPFVLRADGELAGTGAAGPIRDQVVLLRNADGDTYLELKNTALRVLVEADRNEAHQSSGGAATALAMDQPIAGTDFTAEDLRPFDLAHYDSPAIADRNDRQMTVSFDPRSSQYTLVVITFERKRKNPVKTMYYTETLNNLIKMRLDQSPVSLQGTWLPGSIKMEHFKLRTSSELKLRWRKEDAAESVRFDPTGFAVAPPIAWPTP